MISSPSHSSPSFFSVAQRHPSGLSVPSWQRLCCWFPADGGGLRGGAVWQLQQPRRTLLILLPALPASMSDAAFCPRYTRACTPPGEKHIQEKPTIRMTADVWLVFPLRSLRVLKSAPTNLWSPTSASAATSLGQLNPKAAITITPMQPDLKGAPWGRLRTVMAPVISCRVTKRCSVSGCRGQRAAGQRNSPSGLWRQEGQIKQGKVCFLSKCVFIIILMYLQGQRLLLHAEAVSAAN